MKVIEVINRVDELKPNTVAINEKIRWLSVLDGEIKTKIINAHKGGENIKFSGYDENSLEAVLLAPFPYDEMYIYYLESKIDYVNGEFGRYNNSATMFNSAYSDFENWYHRTHESRPINFNYF